MKPLAQALLACLSLNVLAESAAPIAPSVDRVGFPVDYQTQFAQLRRLVRTNDQKIITIFGNQRAASISNAMQLPYPDGSILVMESAPATKDADGGWVKGTVTGLHVMHKEKGFGVAYGPKQSGEWEYAEYAPDRSYLTPPSKSAACAECHRKAGVDRDYVYQGRLGELRDRAGSSAVENSMKAKAERFQRDLLQKHWLDGLYVSIVPASPPGQIMPHTVDQPGNVIHAGVWTGRYLAGVGYQYAITQDPWVRQHGGQILRALRILQEVTGKPGLLARGYVKGHGPVEDWERDGRDSSEWHQGQGAYADYRWYGDVSVDNFNAVLYGYAIYYDLAAEASQREWIARDVDRLMTHLLDNHCRIIDVDGEVTLWGHVGVDPDPAYDDYYRKLYAARFSQSGESAAQWKPSLRASLMLLPDLLIAHRITGQPKYLDLYQRVVARFKDNPDRRRDSGGFSLERLARVNHSSEGQAYEALYNLARLEQAPELLVIYRKWIQDLWEMNWMEGNSLFTWMTRALLPEYRAPVRPGLASAKADEIPHGGEAVRLALESLRNFPADRVLRPVMNSTRPDIELNPHATKETLSARPLPIEQRPLDNEYSWKGNPYQLDGWLKPAVTGFETACDDPLVAWCSDSAGRLFLTLDGAATWRDVGAGLRGAHIQRFVASRQRTYVLHAQTDQGMFITRDGGMSWRPAAEGESVSFAASDFKQWHQLSSRTRCRINDNAQLVLSSDDGQTEEPSMAGWRIPRATSCFVTPLGILAGGPGGFYRSADGKNWTEVSLWPESETGAADFLHAYWMGRYYGFVGSDE